MPVSTRKSAARKPTPLEEAARAVLAAYQTYLDTDDLDVLRDALTVLIVALDSTDQPSEPRHAAGSTDWQNIARVLAGRLVNHAFCSDHPLSAAVPDDCPFCADRAAYRLYRAAAGLPPADPPPAGRMLQLHEIPLTETDD